jgi:GTPase SAR1 family protein
MGCEESKPHGIKNDRPSAKPKNVDDTDQAHKINEDNKVKITLLGNIGTGKTLYYLQLNYNTIGFEDKSTSCSRANARKFLETPKYGKTLVDIWDTAGEETFFPVTASLIKKSDAVMLLYAIDRRETFEN